MFRWKIRSHQQVHILSPPEWRRKIAQKRPFFLELIMAGKMKEILLKTPQNSMACEILTAAVPLKPALLAFKNGSD